MSKPGRELLDAIKAFIDGFELENLRPPKLIVLYRDEWEFFVEAISRHYSGESRDDMLDAVMVQQRVEFNGVEIRSEGWCCARSPYVRTFGSQTCKLWEAEECSGLHIGEREQFFAALNSKLDRGAKEHGDKSLERPYHELVGEIMDEMLDAIGWIYPYWLKLREMEKALRKCEREGIVMIRKSELEAMERELEILRARNPEVEE